MSEKRIAIHIIKQAKIIRALLEYLSLKNKVLATSVSGSSITIPNGNLYHSFIFNMGGIGVPVYRTGDTVMYGLSGNNSSTTHVTRAIRCENMTVSGDDLVVGEFQSNYMWHEGAKHGTPTVVTVSQIIGVEPKLPESLQEFVNSIGGGYCLSRLLGGGISALIQSLKEYNHSYKGYFKSLLLHKQDKCYRYLSNYVRGLQDKQLAKRCIPVFGRSGIQCSKHFNNSICLDSSCIKCNEFNVSSGKNDDDFWRRCVYILFDGGDARRRHHIHRHLSVLFRVSNIQRNAHCNKADIAVRGCAV